MFDFKNVQMSNLKMDQFKGGLRPKQAKHPGMENRSIANGPNAEKFGSETAVLVVFAYNVNPGWK